MLSQYTMHEIRAHFYCGALLKGTVLNVYAYVIPETMYVILSTGFSYSSVDNVKCVWYLRQKCARYLWLLCDVWI